jgi:hypothetical protein
MRRILTLMIAIITLFIFQPRTEAGMNFSLDEPHTGLAGNSMGDVVYDGKYIWVGTGDGLSYSPDSGRTWLTYNNTNGLNANDISALGVFDSTLWVACAYSRMIEGEPIPYGAGFNKTTNRGKDWESHIPDQVDFAGEIAYDIAFDDSMVWAACWYGGLIHSFVDHDTLKWENVFVTDEAKEDYEGGLYQHLDNRFFSVVVDTFCPNDKKLKNSVNDIIFDGRFLWVATQNGLHAIDTDKDTLTYLTFDTSNGLNANGVYSLTGYTTFSETETTSLLCAGLYSGEKEYELPFQSTLTGEGLNFTSDYGYTWDTSLTEQATDLEKFAYDIAIADTVIWAACGKGGLIRSFDRGKTWENVFVDAGAKKRYEEGNLLSRDIFISLAVDTFSVGTIIIWAGTEDGLFKLTDSSGHVRTVGWIEETVAHLSPAQVNNVIIPDIVYQRFGYGHWDPPDSIIVFDVCYPCQGINPGDFFEIPIILAALEPEYEIGGFELEIDFDSLDLTFLGAERGILLSHRQAFEDTTYSWEYFTYRRLPSPLHPYKYKILLYGQADMPDGPLRRGYSLNPTDNFPETYWAVDSAKYYHNGQMEKVEVGATLFWLKFRVADSESLRGLELPLTFEWEHKLSPDTPHVVIEDWDCRENTMFSDDGYDGNDLYVSKDEMQYEPDICDTSLPEMRAIYSILEFAEGGVHICPTSGELSSKFVLALGIQEYDQSKIIWASACTEGLGVSSCSTYKSMDGGETWTSYLGGIWVRDFAFQGSTVWAATDQGLKRTRDGGIYWENFEILDTSGQEIIPSNFTSVCVVNTAIWAGAADGLVKSTDDGKTWQVIKFAQSFKKAIWAGTAAGIFKFIYNYRDVFDTVLNYNSYSDGITGDFVVSTAIQEHNDRKIIWAGTQPTYSGGYGASISINDGDNWSVTLEGDRVWNFAFDDSVVWAATSSGLKRSYDGGETWDVFNYMKDKDEITEHGIFSTEFTSVAIIGDEVWAGNADGLAKAPKNVEIGEDTVWSVFRTYVPIGTEGSKTAYAYPSPFSPMLSTGGVVRIHYKPQKDGPVTIKIYDFAMNLVKTLRDERSIAGIDQEKEWDGRNDKGDIVANGIYFFKVEAPGGQTEWGKLVVLK